MFDVTKRPDGYAILGPITGALRKRKVKEDLPDMLEKAYERGRQDKAREIRQALSEGQGDE